MRHRSTVADLYRLYKEHGPSSTHRMELIDGEIIDMMPPGPFHSASNSRIHRVIARLLPADLRLRCQEPFALTRHNQPQPDLCVVLARDDEYALAHPNPDDIRLVIEVSDSSLEYDLNTKRLIYAKAEIEEYWVIDVQARVLHLFRRPWHGDYTEHLSFTGDEEIQCSTIQELKVTVRELLPSVTLR